MATYSEYNYHCIITIFSSRSWGDCFLVGGLEHVLFSPIVGMMIQSDFHIFFRAIGIPPTSLDGNIRWEDDLILLNNWFENPITQQLMYLFSNSRFVGPRIIRTGRQSQIGLAFPNDQIQNDTWHASGADATGGDQCQQRLRQRLLCGAVGSIKWNIGLEPAFQWGFRPWISWISGYPLAKRKKRSWKATRVKGWSYFIAYHGIIPCFEYPMTWPISAIPIGDCRTCTTYIWDDPDQFWNLLFWNLGSPVFASVMWLYQ